MNSYLYVGHHAPNIINDLFLLQGYVFNREGTCLFDLTPCPGLPLLCGHNLSERFCLASCSRLQQQIDQTFELSSTVEQPLSLKFANSYRRLHIFSSTTAVASFGTKPDLLLWRPILLSSDNPYGLISEPSFQQWLSLSLDHLWRSHRPLTLAVISLSPLSQLLSQEDIFFILLNTLPSHAVLTKLDNNLLALLLPDTTEKKSDALFNALKESVQARVPRLPHHRYTDYLNCVSRTYREWLEPDPPSIQPVNYLLLARLLLQLKRGNDKGNVTASSVSHWLKQAEP